MFLAGDRPGCGGVSRLGVQGSKIYVLSSEPKDHTSLCLGTRPGRPVTWVPTGKTGDRGERTEFYVLKFYVPFLLPRSAGYVHIFETGYPWKGQISLIGGGCYTVVSKRKFQKSPWSWKRWTLFFLSLFFEKQARKTTQKQGLLSLLNP